MSADPFQPSRPKKFEYGRAWAHSGMQIGWHCRWCDQPLARLLHKRVQPDHGAILCPHCDFAAPSL